ncbi:MAG: BadF/BadG/BcrA/BcrD ATPase family protein [Anaerolineae bacterium]
MPHYFLGIDTGATKSHALIADKTGQAVGFGQGGPGNPEVIGYEGLGELLRQITGEALDSAGLRPDQLAGAGFGIAGYDWPSQREPLEQSLRFLELGHTPFEIVNDALIGLLAGASSGWGVCVIAGTSCNCWGWDAQQRVGRMTGFSRFLARRPAGPSWCAKRYRWPWPGRGAARPLP